MANPAIARDEYDTLAASYLRRQSGIRGQYFAGVQLPVLFDHADPKDGLVLDIGTGAGLFAIHLAKAARHVVAGDISPAMLEMAKRELAGHGHANAVVAGFDMLKLPFDDGRFDMVVAMGALMFLPDIGPALAEMARVLKPGGHLVFSVPNADGWTRVSGHRHQVVYRKTYDVRVALKSAQMQLVHDETLFLFGGKWLWAAMKVLGAVGLAVAGMRAVVWAERHIVARTGIGRTIAVVARKMTHHVTHKENAKDGGDASADAGAVTTAEKSVRPVAQGFAGHHETN